MKERFNLKKLREYYGIFLVIYVIAYYAYISFFKGNEYMRMLGGDIFSIMGVIISTACVYYAFKKNVKEEKRFWFFIFLAQFLYTIAEFIWDYYELILKVEVPSPGVTDYLELLYPILVLIGILYLIYMNKKLIDSIKLLFDIGIIMIVLTTLSYSYIMEPILRSSNTNVIELIISIAYPVTDLGLLFGILSLHVISGALRRRVVYVLSAGLIIFTIGDTIYLYLVSIGGYYSGNPVDPIWSLGILLVGLSGLYGKSNEKIISNHMDEAKRPRGLKDYSHMFIPYFMVLLILGVMLTKIKNINSIVIGTILTVIFVVIRQFLIIIENQGLLRLLEKSNQELRANKKILEEKNEMLKKVSDAKEIEARTDFLTNLYNRRYIDECLDRLVDESRISNTLLSVFLLDIDDYKEINDRYGHEVGDRLLKEISIIMMSNTRENEIIGRLGGDEFIGILPGIDIKTAEAISNRVRELIYDNVFAAVDKKVRVSVSIGISSFDVKKDNVRSFISRADEALYMAKDLGKNRVCKI